MTNNSIDLKGYDMMASVAVVGGGGGQEAEVVVVCNNTSHFLVFAREKDGETGRKLASFRYLQDGGSPDMEAYYFNEDIGDDAYKAALEFAVQFATRRNARR